VPSLPALRAASAARPALAGLAAFLVLVAAAVVLPLVLSPYWVQTGMFALVAAVGAIGLNLIMGSAGIFAVAPSFFFAVGAYSYAILAATPVHLLGQNVVGAGLPTGVAALLAVAISGVFGLVLSPLASRLHTLGLAVASIGLIYIGEYFLNNGGSLTGGSGGRTVPQLDLLGYTFANNTSLWYLALACVVLMWLYARNLLRTRSGRALQALRDNPLAATVVGVNIAASKARVFTASGVIYGFCGVLLALAFQTVQPTYFDFTLSVSYLAMIILGGLGSPLGAILGALFVTLVPALVTQYGSFLPLLNTSGSLTSGLTPNEASQIIFGIAIILFLLFAPRGLVSVGPGARNTINRLRGRRYVTEAAHGEAAPAVLRSAEADVSLD
jgi:branched-chain amino acid transport system permease protein